MSLQDSPSDSSRMPPRQGVSLANLFLLVTVCGVLAAHLIPVIAIARKTNAINSLISLCVGGAFAGMFLGIPVGLCQRRPWLGLGLGIPLGFIVGAVVGPLMLLPAERFGELIRISLAGGATLVVFAMLARRFGR